MQGIQEKILLFFQSISSPVLDQAAQLITMLGESTVIVVLLARLLFFLPTHTAEDNWNCFKLNLTVKLYLVLHEIDVIIPIFIVIESLEDYKIM